jgi:hypothetical protein
MLVNKSVVRIENQLHISWEYVQLIVKPFFIRVAYFLRKVQLIS